MRFELTTSTLARLRSTPELRPLNCMEQSACLGSARLSPNAQGNATPLRGPSSYDSAAAFSSASALMAIQVMDAASASIAAKMSSATPALPMATMVHRNAAVT